MDINEFLNKFQGVKQTKGGWMACCPCHDDKKASLRISQGSKQPIILKCFAGCKTENILRSIGLKTSDICHDNRQETKHIGNFPLSPSKWQQSPKKLIITYDYVNEERALVYQVCRYEPKTFKQRRPGEHGQWIWNLNGVKPILYNLPAVIEEKCDVLICEGEKDADNLIRLGFTATTCSGGAGRWNKDFNQYLQGKNIVLLPDNDDPGRKHMQTVAESLKKTVASVKILNLPGLPEKGDVSNYIAGFKGEDISADLVEMIETAGEYKPPKPVDNGRIIIISDIDILAKPKKMEWIVQDMIPMNESTLIHATGGLGKSMFALYLSSILASFPDTLMSPFPFLGFNILQKRVSLVMGSENGWGTTNQRLKVMREGIGTDIIGTGNLFFFSQYEDTTISGKAFSDDKFCNFLIENIPKFEDEHQKKVDVLVIDPLISFTGVNDENKAAEMRPALDAIDRVCKNVQCTPIVIHHDRKEGNAYRGSTAINDWVRNRISLKRDYVSEKRLIEISMDEKETKKRIVKIPVIRVKHEKCNDFQMFEPFLMKMNKNLCFERVKEQMTPDEMKKTNLVVQALKDLGGRPCVTSALVNMYRDLSETSPATARRHIKLAVKNNLIKSKSTNFKGQQTNEYCLAK